MSNPNSPENLGARILDLERRIRAVESAPRAGHTQLEAGIFEVTDVDGTPRVQVGDLTDAGNYGVQIFDDNGERRFRADSDGLKDPYVPLPWRSEWSNGWDAQFTAAEAGGGWITTHSAHSLLVSHKGALCNVVIGAFGDAEIEVRLGVMAPNGERFTDTVSVANDSKQITYRWLHDVPLGGSEARFTLQARHLGGTDEGIVFFPLNALHLGDPDLCTFGGVHSTT